MMNLSFTKMQGLGNDFIVINALHAPFELTPHQIQALSHRHTGIGFDQCLVIEPSRLPDIDFNYRIFNADGSEVGQCGNGARCLAKYVYEKGLTSKTHLRVQTQDRILTLDVQDNGNIRVDMGAPLFSPSAIPLQITQQAPDYTVQLQHKLWRFHALNIGNPHAVIVVEDVQSAPVNDIGAALCHHALFPQGANIGFMQILSPKKIHLRVYERGAGETLACGSGAVAAAVAGILFHGLQPQVDVVLPGGTLLISWPAIDANVSMEGPAAFVYEGHLYQGPGETQ